MSSKTQVCLNHMGQPWLWAPCSHDKIALYLRAYGQAQQAEQSCGVSHVQVAPAELQVLIGATRQAM